MTDTKKIIKDIEVDSIKLAKKEAKLLRLQEELNANPSYKKFMELKSSFDSQYALFRETVTSEMKRLKEQFGVATIEGEFGKITYVQPKSKIVVVDEDEVPDDMKSLTPDLTAISNAYELLNVLPPGVELKASKPYVKITSSTTKEKK